MGILLKKRKDFTVGREVEFGKYPQTKTGKEKSIKWIVLSVENNTALLISKLCLITVGYCDPNSIGKELKFLEWEHSKVRKVLNKDFYERAFSNKEKSQIIEKKISWDNPLLTACNDKVFILSKNEVERFFPSSEERMAIPTGYAVKNGARINLSPKGYTCWWIMPHWDEIVGKIHSWQGELYTKESAYPQAVFQNGEIQYHSRNIHHCDFTVRPSILVNIHKN